MSVILFFKLLMVLYVVTLLAALGGMSYGFYLVFKAIDGKAPEDREEASRLGKEIAEYMEKRFKL